MSIWKKTLPASAQVFTQSVVSGGSSVWLIVLARRLLICSEPPFPPVLFAHCHVKNITWGAVTTRATVVPLEPDRHFKLTDFSQSRVNQWCFIWKLWSGANLFDRPERRSTKVPLLTFFKPEMRSADLILQTSPADVLYVHMTRCVEVAAMLGWFFFMSLVSRTNSWGHPAQLLMP